MGLVGIVFIALGATFLVHHKKDFHNLQSCLKSANTQSRRDSCNQQFKSSVNGN